MKMLLIVVVVVLAAGCAVADLATTSSSTAPPALSSTVSTLDQSTGQISSDDLSLEEYSLRKAECIRDRGFEAEATGVGDDWGVSMFAPLGQVEALEIASDQCEEELGPPPEPPPLPDLETRYALTVEARDCLVGLGYSIPQPPSFDTWADDAAVSGPWSPYEYISDGLSEEEWGRLNQQCPQPPGITYLPPVEVP